MQVELGRENCIFVCVQGHLLEKNLQMLTPLILTPFMSLWSYPNPCTYHCVTFGHCANWLLIVFRFKISKKTNQWKHVRDLELPSIATSRLLDSFHQTINTFFICPLPEPASRISPENKLHTVLYSIVVYLGRMYRKLIFCQKTCFYVFGKCLVDMTYTRAASDDCWWGMKIS